MENQRRIKEFNRNYRPFYIVEQDDGTFSLCLHFDSLEGKYANYCQESFDNYAKSIGDQIYTPIGLKTHGNGYEWEAAFRQIFRNDPDIGRVIFDCEAGGFYCNSNDLDIIEDFGERFKEACEDTEFFTQAITEGIPQAQERERAQEQLMKTVRGHLMKHPNATLDSKTLVQNEHVSMTIFSFDKGEEISTHAAGGDAMVTVLEGKGRFTVGWEVFYLEAGETLIMPKDIPHAVYGEEQFKIQLVVSF